MSALEPVTVNHSAQSFSCSTGGTPPVARVVDAVYKAPSSLLPAIPSGLQEGEGSQAGNFHYGSSYRILVVLHTAR